MSQIKTQQFAPFYFCIDIGGYTGVNAASYEEFLTSIKKVDARSLTFHLERGDFEKWVSLILKDEKLAKDIGKLRNQTLVGKALQNRLYNIVAKRLEQLTTKTQ